MDVLKDITNLENRDLMISLPKDKSWLEYLSHFMKLKSQNNVFEAIVISVPRTAKGNKCFIVFEGLLRGWMEIEKIKETIDNEICIELNTSFSSTPNKVLMDDIPDEEYKYFFNNSNDQ